MVEEALFVLSLLFLVSTALALLFKRFHQPPLVAYLLTGIFAGMINLTIAPEHIDLMIEIGIILLLFLAGLNIRIDDLFRLGKKTLFVGEGHDLLMAVSGFAIAYYLMGLDSLASMYVAIGCTLSSTIVVVKILIERKELGAPHGKVLVGMMVLQDIVSMLALALFTTIGSSPNLLLSLLETFLKMGFTLVVFYWVGQHLLDRLFTYAAGEIELVFLLGIAWCFAGVSFANILGFSTAVGAFIAGFSIAHLSFGFEISDKIRSLQDFGILLFFLLTGMKIQVTESILTDPYLYVLILFVFLFTPFVSAILCSLVGFTKKENFLISVFPTQVSEFTLILLAVGLNLGHISTELFSTMVLVVVVTIVMSAILGANASWLYGKLEKTLEFLEWKTRKMPRKQVPLGMQNHVVILGFGRLGQEVAKYFKKLGKRVYVVEWRPEAIRMAEDMGVELVYGDAGDPDLWGELYLDKADMIVSTIGYNQADDLRMLKWLNKKKSKAIRILETNFEREAKELEKQGADHVLIYDALEWRILKHHMKEYFKKLEKRKKSA